MEHRDEALTEYLEHVVEEELQVHHEGSMPSYMEQIGKADKDLVGVAVMDVNGECRQAGNAQEAFPLESTSKVLSLALALEDCGAEAVFQSVGKEPTGEPYHAIAALQEGDRGVPPNPMINAGAIVATSMIHGRDGDERFARLLHFIRTLANDLELAFNQAMFEAEEKDLNRALFYYMRSHQVIEGSEDDHLVPYLKQTSIEMNCVDLARIGAVLANQGRDPDSGEPLIRPENVRILLTLMFTTGMYGGSGEFAVDVGIPAKSGLSGAILAVVPGRMGLGLIGPALNERGNSIAGVRILKRLSTRWGLGVFS